MSMAACPCRVADSPQSSKAGPGESLVGTLERVVFRNAENHWTVARLTPEEGGPPITVVGSLYEIGEGTPLVVSGQWVDDPRFGRQFKVASYRVQSPKTLLGIERYLGSGLISGIGPELAGRIVDVFGHDTLEVIGKDPERLKEVDGIGPSRAAKIANAWAETQHIQDVMIFLRGHGVSTAYAVRIFKRYGNDAITVIRENPYQLALDVWGIGFRTADAIAQSLGMAKDAPARIEAGVIHVLGKLAEDGHLHVPEGLLAEHAAELLGVATDTCVDAIDRLRTSNLVVREVLGERGSCISLLRLWEAENDAAAAFAAIAAEEAPAVGAPVDEVIAEFEQNAGFRLASAQQEAIRAAAEDTCVVITGGPGVGKTTIVRGIVNLFARGQKSISLAAPTGRAAKRLSESTGREALTIHRLLEYQPQSGDFERGPDNPIESDLVIVDEASMIDIDLFRGLVLALSPRTRLVLVGDIDQLPSVGPGSVLADVIASEAARVIRLGEIFRQAARSQIVVSAHRINEGEMPELAPPAGDDPFRSDFYFIGREDPEDARETVLDLVAERIPERFGFDPFRDLQVLTPMHRGQLGTQVLNATLQERLNPSQGPDRELKRGERVFRIGDKVMQIRNDYDKDVYNGDIGVIASVQDGGLVVELIDGRVVGYERDDLDELVHAYAVSVHKSQGSEYPAIILPLATQHYMMLQRNLLYTAITRGKKLVVVVGSRKAFGMAVRNQSNKERFTYLADRIRAHGY